MPAPLTSRSEVVDRLFSVFRARGFEGASIAELSSATGLGRSSLYHHFPAGKEEMAEAVLDRALRAIDGLFEDREGVASPLRVRIDHVATMLDDLYGGGREPCVLGQLASSELGQVARASLRAAFVRWIEAVAALAAQSGMTEIAARQFAEDWVARLQGALILNAAIGTVEPFQRTLEALLGLAESEPG